MKLVRQLHESGCVPASIAMIAGISYSEALTYFHPRHNWEKQGSNLPRIQKILDKLGYATIVTGKRDLTKLKTNALITISHEAYGPPPHNHHALVWDCRKQRVLDPYPAKWREMKRHLPQQEYHRTLIEIIEVW